MRFSTTVVQKLNRVQTRGGVVEVVHTPRHTCRVIEYRSPAPFVAVGLAMVGGTLLATGAWLGGAAAVVLALIVYSAWQFAQRRGDDDRHVLW